MGQQEFVTAEGLRRDGRRAKELRRIKCQVGVLASADGSAMFEMGNTQVGSHQQELVFNKPGSQPWLQTFLLRGLALPSCCCHPPLLLLPTQVLASVFGPREVDLRSDMQQDKAIIKCEYAMAAFSTGAHTHPQSDGSACCRRCLLQLVVRSGIICQGCQAYMFVLVSELPTLPANTCYWQTTDTVQET